MPLHMIRQDITRIRCDAIVNPTNSWLCPVGGTDEAIHAAAGPKLAEACAGLPGCETGQAVITPGFNLPCKYVIHTVVPVWEGGNPDEQTLLESCYTQSLQLARLHKCRTVAFPLISAGTYGYPKDQVLKVAMETIGAFLMENEMTVTIAVYDSECYALSRELADEVTAYIDACYTGNNEPLHCRTLREKLDRRRQNFTGKSSRKESAKELSDQAEVYSCPEEFAEPPILAAAHPSMPEPETQTATLDEMLRSMDKGFADTLFDYIDAKGMEDVECYKRANIDRKTFSKIKCNKNYKPSKQTVLSFAIALRLTLEETNHLLNTVGMSLSHSSKFDVIIEYFIRNGKYDIFEINETLFAFDQVLLGA